MADLPNIIQKVIKDKGIRINDSTVITGGIDRQTKGLSIGIKIDI